MLHNTQVLSQLYGFHGHTAHWARKFRDWGGHDNGYAEYCHGRARDLSWKAYLEVKKLHETLISGDMQLKQVFVLQPLTAGCTTGFNIEYESGYESTKKVEASLHTKIVTQAGASSLKFLAQASVSSEIASTIKSSASFFNSLKIKKTYYLQMKDCSTGVYVYQTQFNNKLGDDSTVSVLGAGIMICNNPMCRKNKPTSGGNQICKDIKTITKRWGYENSWTFGSCSSNRKYASNGEYTQQCCQPAGSYEFHCKCSYGDGWHGGYVEVGGKRICQDFTTGRSKKSKASFP